MLSPDKAVLGFLRTEFPEARVALGVGVTDLDKEQIITALSTGAFTIGPNGRGGRWVMDFTVFDVDRGRALVTAQQVIARVRHGVFSGAIEGPVGVEVVSLPMFVANDTASQRHAVCTFALQFVGHYLG